MNYYPVYNDPRYRNYSFWHDHPLYGFPTWINEHGLWALHPATHASFVPQYPYHIERSKRQHGSAMKDDNDSRKSSVRSSGKHVSTAEESLEMANYPGPEVCELLDLVTAGRLSHEWNWNGSFTFLDCFDPNASLFDFVDAETSAEVARSEKEAQAVVAAPEEELDWDVALSSLAFHETMVCLWVNDNGKNLTGGRGLRTLQLHKQLHSNRNSNSQFSLL